MPRWPLVEGLQALTRKPLSSSLEPSSHCSCRWTWPSRGHRKGTCSTHTCNQSGKHTNRWTSRAVTFDLLQSKRLLANGAQGEFVVAHQQEAAGANGVGPSGARHHCRQEE